MLGKWQHDYPRALKIVAVTEDAKDILLAEGYIAAPLHHLGSRSELKEAKERALLASDQICFLSHPDRSKIKEIKIALIASHPIFDWSIAELKLFGSRIAELQLGQ